MTQANAGALDTLKLSQIDPGYNPRTYFDPAKHAELVASIRLRGLLQPILVRPSPAHDGRYERIAGDRRLRACLEVFGPDGEIPVNIREMTDQEAMEAAVDENDVRDDVSETEQADAAVRVLEACADDRAEAARRLGWSAAKFDRRMALANLSPKVKTALNERKIKVGHAELLAAVTPENQDRALDTIIASNIDVNKTRELLMKTTQALEAAVFDKHDCTTCPYNSASQRALFETHVDEGHCTNSACFQLKTEAVHEAEAAAAAKAAEAAAAKEAEEAAKKAAKDAVELGSQDTNDLPAVESGQASQSSSRVGSPNAENDDDEPAGSVGEIKPEAPSKAIPQPAAPAASGSHVTIKSLSQRTKDVREKTWRIAVARHLADNPNAARQIILTAAMTGKLQELKPSTMTQRAKILIDDKFEHTNFESSLRDIRSIDDTVSWTALSAIAAGWIMDVYTFANVAAVAKSYEITLFDRWAIDSNFLSRLTKDEIKFIAREAGLIEHLGEKTFAKLWTGKKDELVAGVLNATGFNWKGLLPSCMSLQGKFELDPQALAHKKADAADQADAHITTMAA